eukprot:scaffold244340_cov35-Tisochrysis_lutea.AAC.1
MDIRRRAPMLLHDVRRVRGGCGTAIMDIRRCAPMLLHDVCRAGHTPMMLRKQHPTSNSESKV